MGRRLRAGRAQPARPARVRAAPRDVRGVPRGRRGARGHAGHPRHAHGRARGRARSWTTRAPTSRPRRPAGRGRRRAARRCGRERPAPPHPTAVAPVRGGGGARRRGRGGRRGGDAARRRPTPATTGTTQVALEPVGGADVRAELTLTPASWGTRLDWSCSYPAGVWGRRDVRARARGRRRHPLGRGDVVLDGGGELVGPGRVVGGAGGRDRAARARGRGVDGALAAADV